MSRTDGEQPTPGPDSTLGAGPPETSTQGEAWLGRLRDRLRGRLFGTSSVLAADGAALGTAPDTKAADPSTPERIGRYEVLGRIGSGGMGVIYSALDRSLGRKVAVKILNPDESMQEEQGRARLFREAQALAKLSHPGVIQVYEVGSLDDQVFMAMEFVQGTTLRRWQSHSERGWRAVLTAYVAAGDGLAAAHRAGIVHRDFKPDNVLVRNDDAVRVIDFGLARTDNEGTSAGPLSSVEGDQSPDAPLTRTGTLMGTPAYMAPEQFRGTSADARTDQFSFCVALYEALYGYRPFAGSTVHQLAQNVMHGRVEPPPRYTDVPERVYRVLLRGLEVESAARHPSMGALLRELPSESPRVLRWAGAIVGGLVVAAAAGGWWWSSRDDARREAATVRVRAEFEHSRTRVAEERLRVMQRAGRMERWNGLVLGAAAEVVDRDPTRALGMLKGLDAGGEDWLGPARIVASAAVGRDILVRSVVSKAGPVHQVAVAQDAAVLVFAARTSPLVFVHDIEAGTSAELEGLSGSVRALDADVSGTVVAAGDEAGNVHVWVEGQGRELPRHRKEVTALAVDPTGIWVASGGRQGRVLVSTVGAATPPRVQDHVGPIGALAFSDDGKVLASVGGQGLIKVAMLQENRRRELPHRKGVAVESLTFAGGGAFLDCLGADGRIWRIRTDEWTGTLLPEPEGAAVFARSRWGSTWAMAHRGRGIEVAGSSEEVSRLLRSGAASDIAVSPEGGFIVTSLGKSVQVWQLGSGRGPRVRVDDAVVVDVAYSASAQRIAAGATSGTVRVWDMPGLVEVELGHLLGGVGALSFSPRGDMLAAVGGSAGITVWSLDADEEPRTLSPASSMAPPLRWSSDGGLLAAQLCDSPRRCALVVHDLVRGDRPLTTALGVPFRSLELSPDASMVVAVRKGSYDVIRVFGVSDGSKRRPPWAADEAPRRFVGHAFSEDGTYMRIAGRDGDRLSLWHWDLVDDVIVNLDAREIADVVPDASAHVLLVRGAQGDEIWSLLDPIPQPVAPLPGGIKRFELSSDRGSVLADGDGGVVLMHLATGVQRQLERVGRPYVWLGSSGLASVEARSWVRVRVDPTPHEIRPFLTWLEGMTDVDPGEVLVPVSGLGSR